MGIDFHYQPLKPDDHYQDISAVRKELEAKNAVDRKVTNLSSQAFQNLEEAHKSQTAGKPKFSVKKGFMKFSRTIMNVFISRMKQLINAYKQIGLVIKNLFRKKMRREEEVFVEEDQAVKEQYEKLSTLLPPAQMREQVREAAIKRTDANLSELKASSAEGSETSYASLPIARAQTDSSSVSMTRQMSDLFAKRRDEKEFSDLEISPELGEVETELGRGAFGVVSQRKADAAQFPESKQVSEKEKSFAVKEAQIGDQSNAEKVSQAKEDFRNEVSVLQYIMAHPRADEAKKFIPKVYWANENHIVQKMCNRGSMNHFMQSEEWNHLPRDQQLEILSKAADAMRYLEETGIVHNDIAARNFLIHKSNEGKWKVYIADMGMAHVLPEGEASYISEKKSGPIKWMAPERISVARRSSSKSDSWAFGVFLIESVIGTDNYRKMGINNRQFAQNLLNGDKTLFVNDQLSKRCSNTAGLFDLIDALTAINPNDRPSFAEISERLRIMAESIKAEPGSV